MSPSDQKRRGQDFCAIVCSGEGLIVSVTEPGGFPLVVEYRIVTGAVPNLQHIEAQGSLQRGTEIFEKGRKEKRSTDGGT